MKLTLSITGWAGRALFEFGVLALLASGLASYLGRHWNGAFFEAMRLESNQVLEQAIGRNFEQGRSSLWEYMATGDEESYRRAQRSFSIVDDRVKELESRTYAPDRRARLDQLAETLLAYEGLTLRFQGIKGRNVPVDNPEARALLDTAISLGNQVESQGEGLSSAYRRAASEQKDAASDLTSRVARLGAGLGFASILAALLSCIHLRRRATRTVAAAE